MFAVGELARRYAVMLVALFFLAAFAYCGFKIWSLQNAIDVAQAQREKVEQDLQILKGSVRTLETVRAADLAAIKSATDGAALAERKARQLRKEFDRVIANDEAARNFLDQRLPDSIRLYVNASDDHGLQNSNAAAVVIKPLQSQQF